MGIFPEYTQFSNISSGGRGDGGMGGRLGGHFCPFVRQEVVMPDPESSACTEEQLQPTDWFISSVMMSSVISS